MVTGDINNKCDSGGDAVGRDSRRALKSTSLTHRGNGGPACADFIQGIYSFHGKRHESTSHPQELERAIRGNQFEFTSKTPGGDPPDARLLEHGPDLEEVGSDRSL